MVAIPVPFFCVPGLPGGRSGEGTRVVVWDRRESMSSGVGGRIHSSAGDVQYRPGGSSWDVRRQFAGQVSSRLSSFPFAALSTKWLGITLLYADMAKLDLGRQTSGQLMGSDGLPVSLKRRRIMPLVRCHLRIRVNLICAGM